MLASDLGVMDVVKTSIKDYLYLNSKLLGGRANKNSMSYILRFYVYLQTYESILRRNEIMF